MELLGHINGRVIVTGVGKSGHIGNKLAATFASTGTPAFFVHPVEANHGDLGMITHDDVIVAMSWGGESAELRGIISYSRRFSIPMIAITAGETSTLARESDVVLLLPKEQEACPHGLAPTTSTLLQLAIGDALAVALLEARGFTAEDFRTFHPAASSAPASPTSSISCTRAIAYRWSSSARSMPEAAMTLSKMRFRLRRRDR